MDKLIQKSLIDRIWYLPASYQENAKRKNWDFLSSEEILGVDDWKEIDWETARLGPFIFLSRAPITFGHSILTIPKPGRSHLCSEIDFFRWSFFLIERVLMAFNLAFAERRIHAQEKFSGLARESSSKGSYLKTLILKASANEDLEKTYKVHLIPYFESNAMDCQLRFIEIHGWDEKRQNRGGLLGWLGQREDEVDKIEVDTYLKPNFDHERYLLHSTSDLARELRVIYYNVSR